MVIFHGFLYVYQRIVSRKWFQLRVAHDSPRRAELVLFCCDTNPFNWRSFVMGFCCRPSMPGRHGEMWGRELPTSNQSRSIWNWWLSQTSTGWWWLEHDFYIKFPHPNWWSQIFQRSRAQPPTRWAWRWLQPSEPPLEMVRFFQLITKAVVSWEYPRYFGVFVGDMDFIMIRDPYDYLITYWPKSI